MWYYDRIKSKTKSVELGLIPIESGTVSKHLSEWQGKKHKFYDREMSVLYYALNNPIAQTPLKKSPMFKIDRRETYKGSNILKRLNLYYFIRLFLRFFN